MTLTTAQNIAAAQEGFINWKHACCTGEIEHLDYLNQLAMSIYKKNRKPSEIMQDDRSYHKRIIVTLALSLLFSALIWASIVWVVNMSRQPGPGERDHSGYGAFDGKRFNN